MGHAIEETRIRTLVDTVYAAAVAPEGWSMVLERLADVFAGGFADIFTRSHDREHFGGLAHGLDRSDYDDNFLGVWFKRNVWGQASPVQVAGEVLSTRSMVDLAVLRRSEIFNEYLDPRGLHEGLRLSLWVGERELQDISILRPWSGGAYGPAEVALAEEVLPHLQRAAAVTRRLRDTDFRLDVGAGGAGSGGFAAFAFDRSGAPLWFNAAAETMLADGGALSLEGGELRAATPAATRHLRRALGRAAGRAGTLPEGGTVALPRSGDVAPLTLVVLPASNSADWATSRPAAAVAFLRDPAALTLSRERLRALFPLTRAEADLAEDLLAGRTLRDVARRSGRSLNTLRCHLAHLMEKTGTGRQADLVRLLGDIAALAEPPWPAHRSGRPGARGLVE